MKNIWLTWAQEIQSISQAGLEYSRDPYDIERFERLREISVEILSEYTNLDSKIIADLFANESGYQTPKIDVRAVVNKGDKLLFVRENNGKWSLPGGWADINYSARENVKKEVKEEAGINVEPEKIIAVFDRNKHYDDNYPYSVYSIFIKCKYIDGTFIRNIETTAAEFFPKDEIPGLCKAKITQKQLDACYAFIEGRSREVIFD